MVDSFIDVERRWGIEKAQCPKCGSKFFLVFDGKVLENGYLPSTVSISFRHVKSKRRRIVITVKICCPWCNHTEKLVTE